MAPPRAAMPTDLVSLLLHKQWADAELLRAARGLSRLGQLVARPFLVRIVRHFHGVDSIFRAHLLGVAHGFTSAAAGPRSLDELEERVRVTDAWFVAYTRDLDTHRANETLLVQFTDGDRQTLARSEMLLHVALHGAYHRGNADVVLRLCGAGALPDRLTTYLRLAASATSDADA
jgi:uncharacterized damage-inducible protein DinB